MKDKGERMKEKEGEQGWVFDSKFDSVAQA